MNTFKLNVTVIIEVTYKTQCVRQQMYEVLVDIWFIHYLGIQDYGARKIFPASREWRNAN